MTYRLPVVRVGRVAPAACGRRQAEEKCLVRACCVVFGRWRRRIGATGADKADWTVPRYLLGRGPEHARGPCRHARRYRPSGRGDAAGGAVVGLQVQSAAGCGAGDAAGGRRGGAARAVGLPTLGHRQRRQLVPARHHQPRHHRQRRQQPARLRGRRGAAAVSRLPHGERGQRGGGDRSRRARDAAAGRAERAAGGGDGLQRRGARHGHRAPAREQRHGADARSARHPGPLQCGRGDAHRRGAGAGPPRRRGGRARSGARQPEDVARHLRARGRPPAEPPGGGARQRPGGQVGGRERRHLAAREPERGGGALPRAGGALQHRPGARRAAADGAAGGQLRQALRRHRSVSTGRRPAR